LYFKVTITDAIELGLLDVINRVQGTHLNPEQFVAGCRARAGSEEIFQQSYMCNPMGSAAANIVEWSAIERCRADYQIERLHLEAAEIPLLFGEFNPRTQDSREEKIHAHLHEKFRSLLSSSSSFSSSSSKNTQHAQLRLGFDVAASGQGDLAAIYIDEAQGDELWLRALFTCRTEDWHFLKTILFFFLKNLRRLQAAGDESGLGRQICWEAAAQFSSRFTKVNFSTLKHDLGFTLTNQLSVARKRFPRSEQDIAADYFALRKVHTGTRWTFTEGRNYLNSASHCDIAWAGALASHAHTERPNYPAAAVLMEDGSIWRPGVDSAESYLFRTNDPAIWKPFRY
jgi:phage FluMu gp28-like protein